MCTNLSRENVTNSSFRHIRDSSSNLYLFLCPAFCFNRWYCQIKFFVPCHYNAPRTRKTGRCALSIFDKVLFFLQKRKKFSKNPGICSFYQPTLWTSMFIIPYSSRFLFLYAWSNLYKLIWRILKITLSISVGKILWHQDHLDYMIWPY